MTIDFEHLVSFLQALVRLPSLSGEEGSLIERIAEEMAWLGYSEIFRDKNGSLIGIIQGKRQGPTLLLDGHCDVVGITAGWSHDPWAGEIRKGKMFGRGTSDMKGALAAMVYAAAAVDRGQLNGRVVVSATVMEEVMEGVALAAVISQIKPDAVIIGEATELNLNIGGRGRAEIKLESFGRSAHSSTPHLGINAVQKMIPAIQAIERLTFTSHPLLGSGLMVLTDIISQPYPGHSVIPTRCLVTYDRRLLHHETADVVIATLKDLPEFQDIRVYITEGVHTTYTGATLRGPKFFPAWLLSPDHPLVQRALTGLHMAGFNPKLGGYRFCTNAAYSAGQAGIPTIGFGPSSEALAHVDDEYIELEDVAAAARGYQAIIASVLSAERLQP